MNDDGNKILVCNFLISAPSVAAEGFLFLKKKEKCSSTKKGGPEMGVARIDPGPRPARTKRYTSEEADKSPSVASLADDNSSALSGGKPSSRK